MFVRNITALAFSGLILANCATAPGDESFCGRNRALCIGGAVVVVVVAAGAIALSSGPNSVPSDRRLKKDVQPAGILANGLHLYSFRYWNDDRTFVGVMAQDLLEDERFRNAVIEDESGYYMVDLATLGLGIEGEAEQFLEAGRAAIAEAQLVVN